MLAKAAGVSLRSVQRILEANQLAPHRIRTFKLSNDPQFAEKLKDVVGLYVDPPAHAVVLSVDEKSQIQALDRTQPGLPMKPGRAGTMTHDYKRNGTTTLFAALNILDGTVIGRNIRAPHGRPPILRQGLSAYRTQLSTHARPGVAGARLRGHDVVHHAFCRRRARVFTSGFASRLTCSLANPASWA